MSGTLPDVFDAFTELKTLTLADDRSGLILRPNFGSIPPSVFMMPTLQLLRLSNMTLVGSIPSEIGNATYLTTLDFSTNKLVDDIPSEIGSLTRLETLSLTLNHLTGGFPTEMGDMTSLLTLQISSIFEPTLRTRPFPTFLDRVCGHFLEIALL